MPRYSVYAEVGFPIYAGEVEADSAEEALEKAEDMRRSGMQLKPVADEVRVFVESSDQKERAE